MERDTHSARLRTVYWSLVAVGCGLLLSGRPVLAARIWARVSGLLVAGPLELRVFFKLGAATVLALYSHYYCALWLMFLYLFLLADILRARRFEQLKPFLATAGAATLLFAPWLTVPLSTGGGYRPTAATAHDCSAA